MRADVAGIFLSSGKKCLYCRGVRNPMKISDMGFPRTEPTSKFKNRKLGFRGSVFKKAISAVLGRFFTFSHSQFVLQHDTINGQSIFLHAVSLHF